MFYREAIVSIESAIIEGDSRGVGSKVHRGARIPTARAIVRTHIIQGAPA